VEDERYLDQLTLAGCSETAVALLGGQIALAGCSEMAVALLGGQIAQAVVQPRTSVEASLVSASAEASLVLAWSVYFGRLAAMVYLVAWAVDFGRSVVLAVAEDFGPSVALV
jgi:hypothetical protein